MKQFKRIISYLLIVIVMAVISLSVFADEADVDRAKGYHVYDDADLLSDSQWTKLEQKASDISEKYNCGVYVVTVDDFTDYTNDYDVISAAENIYDMMDFGYGSGRDGQLLLLSMADRDYAIVAYGDFANSAFTDYGKDVIADAFLDDFRGNDWYGGFTDYLNECEYMLEEASNGTPVDILIPDGDYPYYPEYKPTLMDYVRRFLIMLLPSSLVSLVTCAILRSKSKTVHIAADANRYVNSGLRLFVSNDMFLHRSQARRRIETARDSHSSFGGGGGSHFGGTTVSSSGFSSKSGKF